MKSILCFILLCATMADLPANGQSTKETDSEPWAIEHYDEILRRLLPDLPKEVHNGNIPQEFQWILVARVVDPDRPGEFWFSLRRSYSHEITATIRTPDGKSIFAQIEELRQEEPTASPEAIAQKVRIREYNFTARSVPELQNLAREFESLRTHAQMPDTTMSHPVKYYFWTMSLWGQTLQAQLIGPGPQATRQPHPLVEFVEDFRRVMGKHL
jgi:hypothetical protein